MRVYRFEHAEHGNGAVSYGGCSGPVPEYDGFPYDWKELMVAKGSAAGGWFGLAHLEEGPRWFNADQRRRWAEQGDIVVSVYEVADDHVLIGGRQVIFVREKAQKVDELCPYSFGPSRTHQRHVRGEDRYSRYMGWRQPDAGWRDRTTAEEVRMRTEERTNRMMDLYRMAVPSGFKEMAERLMQPIDFAPIEKRAMSFIAFDECPAPPPAQLDEELADKPGYVRVNNGSTTCRAELAGLYRRK